MRQKQNKQNRQDKTEILKLIEKSRDTEQTTAVEKEIKNVFISHHIRMIFQLILYLLLKIDFSHSNK